MASRTRLIRVDSGLERSIKLLQHSLSESQRRNITFVDVSRSLSIALRNDKQIKKKIETLL